MGKTKDELIKESIREIENGEKPPRQILLELWDIHENQEFEKIYALKNENKRLESLLNDRFDVTSKALIHLDLIVKSFEDLSLKAILQNLKDVRNELENM